MRLSNLWLYYYTDGVAPPQPQPAADPNDDSRSWPLRFGVRALLTGVEGVLQPVGSLSVITGTAVRVEGMEAWTEVGSVSVQTWAAPRVSTLAFSAELRPVQASGHARVLLSSLEAVSAFGNVGSGSGSNASVSGVLGFASLGSVGVHIGPDLVVEEEELLFLLMEVA